MPDFPSALPITAPPDVENVATSALPAPPPDVPSQATSPVNFDDIRKQNPHLADASDYQVARSIYDQGLHGDKESFPAFATRIGIQQPALGTAANSFVNNASLGLADPTQAALSGLGSLLTGGNFGDAYHAKRQDLADKADVGSYQHPVAGFGGHAAGDLSDLVVGGPLIRAGAEAVPGLSTLAKSGPLGDMIVKMFGLSEAKEIPKIIEQQAASPDGVHPGQIAIDLGRAGLEGGGAAMLGSGVSKGLGALGSLSSLLGQGVSDAGDILQAVPRTLATRGAAKLGQGFQGDLSPAQAGLELDKKFYTGLLAPGGWGSINVNQGATDLGTMMQKPGYAMHILQAVKNNIPAANGEIDAAIDSLTNETGDGVQQGTDAINTIIERLKAQDPTGQSARDFIGGVYSELIPKRLAGPFDPGASFERNLISGSLSDKGKLITPPLRTLSMGNLGQQAYERVGGGAGMVMAPLATTAPKTWLGGAANVAAQPLSIATQLGGKALNATGKAVSGLGEPGTTLGGLADAAGMPGAGAAQSLIGKMPNAYQQLMFSDPSSVTGTMGAAAKHITDFGNTWFPDTYTPPEQQHTEVEPQDAQKWLASADPPTAKAYVSSKLGQQVASQIPDDDLGFKGAMYSLFANPQYRKMLS